MDCHCSHSAPSADVPTTPLETPNAPVEPTNTKITTKFRLDDVHAIAQVYDGSQLLGDILADLAAKFRMDPEHLQLSHMGVNCRKWLKTHQLFDMPANEFSIVELDLGLSEAALEFNDQRANRHRQLVLDPEVFYSHYHLPELIEVQLAATVDDGSGDRNAMAKRLIVEIVNRPVAKSFVGGYRDSRTNIEYHNAFTQTGPAAEAIRSDGIVSRPTQTLRTRNQLDDTRTDHSVQAFGTATELIYVPSITDTELQPQPYESYEDRERRINMLGKVILLQRNVRRYLWQRLIRTAAAEYRQLCRQQTEIEAKRRENLLNDTKQECVVRTFPKTREDFNVLTVHVHKWKQAQLKRINAMATGGARIAMINAVLDQEIGLLNAIARKAHALRMKNEVVRTERKLDAMGRPVKWVGYKNVVCEMDLLRTQKIRFLVDLYREMKRPDVNRQDRMALIDKVCDVLNNEEPSRDRDELVELLLREQKLLTCHMKSKNLQPLRMRQLQFMVCIIETYDRTIETIPTKDKTRLLCGHCKSVRPIDEFELNTRQTAVTICLGCTAMQTPPIDLRIYRTILRSVQREERRRGALASYAFIARENDVRMLIDTIWHGHSVLSQSSVVAELRLPRWLAGADWSPWNCVCLTEAETRAHARLKAPDQLYDAALIAKVERKHSLARLSFRKLELVSGDYLESREWWRAGLAGEAGI